LSEPHNGSGFLNVEPYIPSHYRNPFNGQPMKVLIDTGADLSVIRTKTAKQWGAQRLNDTTSSGKALGGNPGRLLGVYQ